MGLLSKLYSTVKKPFRKLVSHNALYNEYFHDSVTGNNSISYFRGNHWDSISNAAAAFMGLQIMRVFRTSAFCTSYIPPYYAKCNHHCPAEKFHRTLVTNTRSGNGVDDSIQRSTSSDVIMDEDNALITVCKKEVRYQKGNGDTSNVVCVR